MKTKVKIKNCWKKGFQRICHQNIIFYAHSFTRLVNRKKISRALETSAAVASELRYRHNIVVCHQFDTRML